MKNNVSRISINNIHCILMISFSDQRFPESKKIIHVFDQSEGEYKKKRKKKRKL